MVEKSVTDSGLAPNHFNHKDTKMAETASPRTGKPPRAKVVENVALDADMLRMFNLIKITERDHEAVMAELRSQRAAANATRDKAYTDAADALKSRGVTKRILRELYDMSRRKEDDVREEFSAKVWAMRAAGMPIGTQLAMFDDGFSGQDEALRKAHIKGRNDYADNVDSKDNPFQPSSQPGQHWLRGWTDAMNENINAAGKN